MSKCYRCDRAFGERDLITVEPDGRTRHYVHCPDLCTCGGRQKYSPGKFTCIECGKVKLQLPIVYVIGSLRSPRVPATAQAIRGLGYEVFDDWYAAGPEADDYWQRYEQARGHSYLEGLVGHAAYHVFEYDRHHLDRAGIGILVLPAGKSGHLELGYLIGQGKPCYILLDKEPERWDVMYRFARRVFTDLDALLKELTPE